MARFIRFVRVHFCPDIDAIVARVLANLGDAFDFSDEVEFKFVPSGMKMPEKDDCLDLDTGGGSFDHHNGKGTSGKCATDLMAEFLGFADVPWLRLVLDRIRANDLHAEDLYGGKFTDKPHGAVSLRQIFNGTNQMSHELGHENSARILLWAGLSLIHAAKDLDGFRKDTVWRQHLRAAGQRLLAEKGNTSNALTSFLRMDPESWFASKGDFEAETALFSICGSAYGLLCMGESEEKVAECLDDFLKSLWVIQEQDEQAWLDWQAGLVFRVQDQRRQQRPLNVACMISDSVKASAASRSKKAGRERADICIVVRYINTEHQQVQILGTDNETQKLLLTIGTTMRLAECEVSGRNYNLPGVNTLGWSDNVPEWYIANPGKEIDRAFLISNRTLTNPVAPKTVLTISSIARIVENVIRYGCATPPDVLKKILEAGQKANAWPTGSLFRDIRN